MEGVTAAKSIEALITAIGLPATLIVLGVVAFFLFREIKKENESTRKSIDSYKTETAKQIDGLRLSTENKIDELKKHSDEKDNALQQKLANLEKEVKFIQHDYMTKAEHYQDTEGWKTEIQGIRQEVSKLPIELLKLLNTTKK